ncbi:MAG: hypothetical protein RLY20_3437 [Verrucomicrobiota bacterium]|jgi:hypothetical protein
MKFPRLSGAVLAVTCLTAAAAQPITVEVHTSQPGAEISPVALGLSYETSLLLPGTNGTRYFRPDNQPLVTLFQTLGIRSLRIGGNSVDATNIAIPSEADVRSLFEFAKAARVKVIYSVRLQDGDARSAARFARFIGEHYADALDCFAIGNEPGYYKDYTIYTNRWCTIRDAMVAAYPPATFCGPDQNPSPELCAKLVQDFGGTNGRLAMITQHSYSFGCSYQNYKEKDPAKLIPVDAATAREKMLKPDAYAIYEPIRKGMADAVAGTPVKFRLAEVNSYWFSGLKGASDRYASALWSADYLHWWTAHGAEGLNFHTGDRTGGSISLPCRYAAFVTADKGYEVRPLAYGLKLFDLGGHGRTVALTVAAPEQNIAAYAVLNPDRVLFITLINPAHGTTAKEIEAQIKLDAPMSARAEAIFLTAENNDIAGGSDDVKLGGARIKSDGSWNGRWSKLARGAANNVITLKLPPASAAVVRAKLK